MKKLLPIFLLGGLVLISTSSAGPSQVWYGYYTPIFMEYSELERSVFFDPKARDLINPGKIYTKDNLIFINEKYKGVHIIDNSTPANPKHIGFVVAPGCMDMAVKGNTLYLDNAVDLVAFNLITKEVTERIKQVFPEPLSPENFNYYGDRPSNTIVVGWRK